MKKRRIITVVVSFLYILAFFVCYILMSSGMSDFSISHSFTIFRYAIIGMIILSITFPIVIFFIRNNNDKKTETFLQNMKTLQTTNEFDTIYNKLLIENINELEISRKKLKKSCLIKNIIATILVLIYLVVVFSLPNIKAAYPNIQLKSDDLKVFLYLLFAIYGIVIWFNTNKQSKYSKLYKNTIIHSFLKNLNSNLRFSDKVPAEVGIYKKYTHSTFDKGIHNYFEADDYICDNINNIQMCDVVTKNTGGKHTETIFRGMFSFSPISRNFNTIIKISKNDTIVYNDNPRITMDSSEFENYFNVNADDRILATRILTSDIMEKILLFYNKFKLSFEIIINEDILYLRFFTGPMFEPKASDAIIDKNTLFVYYNIILFITELSNTINNELNNIDI